MLKGLVAIPVLFFAVTGCQRATSKAPNANELYQQQRLQHYRLFVYPKMKQRVHSGDLVLRLGTDITSEMLRQMNQTDPSFSHCGIASIENDTVFVYHAIGGEFNPDQKLKRETLYRFGLPAENKTLGVVALSETKSQKSKLILLAQQCFAKQIPFDMQFDYSSDDRMYCAEFVSKCISRSLSDSSWLHFSQAGNFKYVAVDNLYHNSLAKEIERLSY